MASWQGSEPPRPAWAPVVGVAITDGNGRLLLMRRRDDGSWCLPGGRLQAGESFREAAARECREELGHDIEVTGLVGAGSNPAHQIHRYPDGELVHFVGVVVTARLRQEVRKPDGEALETGWFTAASLPSPILAGDVPAIVHVLSGGEQPLID